MNFFDVASLWRGIYDATTIILPILKAQLGAQVVVEMGGGGTEGGGGECMKINSIDCNVN